NRLLSPNPPLPVSSLFLVLFARLDRFFDRADHVEGLLWKIIVLAFDDFFEAFDRVFELAVLAFAAGELRRDMERLREKLLNLARARNHQLIFVRQFVQTEDSDDVLKIFVALQD